MRLRGREGLINPADPPRRQESHIITPEPALSISLIDFLNTDGEEEGHDAEGGEGGAGGLALAEDAGAERAVRRVRKELEEGREGVLVREEVHAHLRSMGRRGGELSGRAVREQ